MHHDYKSEDMSLAISGQDAIDALAKKKQLIKKVLVNNNLPLMDPILLSSLLRTLKPGLEIGIIG